MSILRFTLKYNYDKSLSFDDSQVELISSIDDTIIDDTFDGNIRKFYRFAHDLALDKDIDFQRRRYRDGRHKVLEVSYDRGKYILNRFNMEAKKKARNLKLKKMAFTGSMIAFASVSGITIKLKSNSKPEEAIETTSVPNYFIDNLNDAKSSVVITDKFAKEASKSDEMKKKTTEKINKINFSYDDRSDSDPVKSASKYDKYFEEMERKYGVDKDLLKAIMCQESGGVHLNYSKNGHAYGGMQIESINFGHTIHAYNFDEGKDEDEVVSKGRITDAEYNIKIGAMILQYHLNRCNYDIAKAIQSYNFGEGNMRKLGDNWKDKRASLGIGDPEYLEHVLSFIKDDTVLTFKKKDGKTVKVSINNSKAKEKEKEKENSEGKTK